MISSVVINELNETANEVQQFDTKMASEITSVAMEMKKEAMTGFIQPGMRIVCLNPVQGIYKGRTYIAAEKIDQSVIVITELDGTHVGAFRAERFCQDHEEF